MVKISWYELSKFWNLKTIFKFMIVENSNIFVAKIIIIALIRIKHFLVCCTTISS